MSETPHYSGSCQCGAVTFDVEVDLAHTKTCNCSRCQRLGWIMAFTPAAQFHLKSGEDRLSEYKFNREIIRHLFCATCGIESFARASLLDGTKMVAVNVRCLDGVDIDGLQPQKADGKSL
jgi:hypothetical protein